MEQVQQGDVCITRVDSIPEQAKKLAHRTLRQGEHTGHAHVAVGEDTELYELDGVLFARVPTRTTITHEEHRPVVLDPGVYSVTGVKEYDHFLEESREIAD